MSRTRSRGGCASDPSCCAEPPGDLEGFAEIVDSYIRCYRPRSQAEREFFRGQATLTDAIHIAALCKRQDGKRQPHQYRIPEHALREGERNLQACRDEISRCRSFEDVRRIVQREMGSVHGIGRLTTYDVATRIAAHLEREPELVYLHAGVAEGARSLGFDTRRESLEVGELPDEFHTLSASEAEDCLCIFKDAIARIVAAQA